ncbi:MAG: CBS domain-containing protein [Flavobacteriaceae bacterium]|nr:CBS domain-containing protein [Flavobacteriaceae bacterium]MDZ4146849.1 CBS domain-containing protein [Flavobacteriaceae bacterium]
MGIKSFQGATEPLAKPKCAPLCVSDYMSTSLITFKPDQPVVQVMELLIKHRISGGPVVDDGGNLVGMISEGDCMKEISECRYYNMPMNDQKVDKYMDKSVETINWDLSVFDAATLFCNARRNRFPVMKDGKLIGQISRSDVLKAAINLKSDTWMR